MVPILSTLVIRLAGVDSPWLRRKLGISVLIKTGPAATSFFPFVMNISGAKV